MGVAAAAEPPQRPNLLLIVLDTVRYDAVSPANTPFLDSLSKRGVVFTAAYSTHDFTPPSHFSMETGFRDGLATDDDRPENGVAWQLGRNGYFTFASVANSLLGQTQMPVHRAFADFRQVGDIITGASGLDVMNDLLRIDARLAFFQVRATPHTRAMLYFAADRMLPVCLEQMRAAKQPFFGFVNLIDAHDPYVPHVKTYPPERLVPLNFNGDIMARRLPRELLKPDTIEDPARRAEVKAKLAEVRSPYLLAADLPPEALAIYKHRYMATVRETDETLRQFFDAATREHLLDNTIVIITSDHGEAFGEDGYVTHNLHDHGDFDATHHVPLIVVLPPRFARTAARIDRRVSIANLAATMYDAAGVDWTPFAERYDGWARSLLPLFTSVPPRVGRAVPPERSAQDHSEAEREREKAMKSLGYVH
jgi:arylsulfatase A-like enzyme